MSYGGQQNRTEWYDRAPATYGLTYGAGSVAPHGQITRWTYTTPASRKAIVESALTEVLRDQAAAAAGLCYASIFCNLFSGSPQLTQAAELNNNLGSFTAQNVGGAITLLASNTMSGATADGSTGGTHLYRVDAKLTEFDA